MDKSTNHANMSPQAFAALGLQDVAYIKPVVRNGVKRVAVHAADGTEVALVDSRELAMALVRQHGLEPLSAH